MNDKKNVDFNNESLIHLINGLEDNTSGHFRFKHLKKIIAVHIIMFSLAF